MLLSPRKDTLRFICQCTYFPTVITIKQELVKMKPTCNFFRNKLPEAWDLAM